MKFINNFIGLFYTAIQLFVQDKLLIRSNAIAYSIVIAIIPFLTILIRIANLNQKELMDYISRFFAIYGITGTQPILEIIQDILSRSNTISGIGFIFLIYATLKIFQDLEESANQVFQVESRGFLIRTSIYTSWMIFLPLVIVFLIDFSYKAQNFLKAANYLEIKKNAQNYFLLREDKIIEVYNSNFEEENKINFINKTDFYALNRKIIINQDPLDFDPSVESIKSFLKKAIRMEISKDYMIIACEPSFIFISMDGGINWDYRYFIFSNRGKSFEFPKIEDIKIYKDDLYILLTFSRQSYVFIMEKAYLDIKNKYIFDSFYNKIYIYNGKIFLSGQGNLLYKEIESDNWNLLNISNINTTYENFYLQEDFSIFLTATKRVLIYQNGTIQFPTIRINQLENINNLKILNDNKGFIFGKKDLRYTINGGKDWFITKIFNLQDKEEFLNFSINDLIESNQKDQYYLVGENQSIYGLQIYSIAIDPKTDLPIVKFKLTLKKEISKLKNSFPFLVSLALNYFYIVMILTFFYMILPNKKIPIKAALAGGIISSLGIVLFIVIFKLILPFFTSSRFVYGIWFTIPIGMMILLTTVQIFLFGLEIVKLTMYPNLIKSDFLKKLLPKKEKEIIS